MLIIKVIKCVASVFHRQIKELSALYDIEKEIKILY